MMSVRVHDVAGVGEAKQHVIVPLAVGIGIRLRLTHQGTAIARVHVVGEALLSLKLG